MIPGMLPVNMSAAPYGRHARPKGEAEVICGAC